MIKDYYDVIVVGAGPAGSTAARYAASGGASVLVLEKDRDVGYPVRCGEAASHEGISRFIQPDPKWIATTAKHFRLIAPNGKKVIPKLDGIGYVLERRVFDYELAKIAAMQGATVVTKAYVYDLLRDYEGKANGVKILLKDEEREIACKIVIAADGVESRVGRWAGIDTTCSIHDMESCAQMTISGIELDDGCLDFYFGKNIAPGGYLWVFPKGRSTANVGLGITVEESKKKPALHYLQEFIQSKFPQASILTQIAAGVPCAKTCSPLVKNNVMLVGDAGHQVNPISGGGITSGMIGGMIAGEVSAEAIKRNDFAFLKEYEKRWQEQVGWKYDIYYKMKEAISNFTDEDLNKIAEGVQKLSEEKQTLGAIFRTALWNKPSLLVDVAKVFVG